jgi:hypothetical protein
LIEFPLRQQKSVCCLLSALLFLLHTCLILDVNFDFQLVSELGTL